MGKVMIVTKPLMVVFKVLIVTKLLIVVFKVMVVTNLLMVMFKVMVVTKVLMVVLTLVMIVSCDCDLPGAKVELAVREWHCQVGAEEASLQCHHTIRKY